MVFDISHDAEGMWPTFAKAFGAPALPPHMDKKAMSEVRRKRAAFDRKGGKEEPPIIAQGSSGTGF